MEHSRCIISGVLPAQRISHHRAAQEPIQVSVVHAEVHSVRQAAAGNVHLLSQRQKYHCHTGILTNGHALLPGHLEILCDILQDPLAHRAFFLLLGSLNNPAQVIRQYRSSLDTEFFHQSSDLFTADLSHFRRTSFPMNIPPQYGFPAPADLRWQPQDRHPFRSQGFRCDHPARRSLPD